MSLDPEGVLRTDVDLSPVATPTEAKRCTSRKASVRCQKLKGHGGMHGFEKWRLVESHRWG